MTEFLLESFINPMKVLEWEDHFPPNQSKNPTTEQLLEFLCSLGFSGDMAAFKRRYRKVSARDQRLFLFPREPRLAENLFDPLRQAKTSYLIGNYVAVIGLCGIVAEKVAIFIHMINTPDKTKWGEFERLEQSRRVRTLKDRSLVSSESVKAFGTIRAARKHYLHYWTSTRDDKMAQEAARVYGAAVELILTIMSIGFTNGTLTLEPKLIAYLAEMGKIRSH